MTGSLFWTASVFLVLRAFAGVVNDRGGMTVFFLPVGFARVDLLGGISDEHHEMKTQKSAGQLGLASDVVHPSWGAGQWSCVVCFIASHASGPLALCACQSSPSSKNGEVVRLTELSGSVRHCVNQR
jgi:hypothetical protein